MLFWAIKHCIWPDTTKMFFPHLALMIFLPAVVVLDDIIGSMLSYSWIIMSKRCMAVI
jgi:hypothetical protein